MAVGDDFEYPADGRGDDGLSGPHGFDEGQGEGFAEGRHGVDVEGGEGGVPFFLPEKAGEDDVQPEGVGLCLQSLPLTTAVDQDDLGSYVLTFEESHGFEEVLEALLLL